LIGFCSFFSTGFVLVAFLPFRLVAAAGRGDKGDRRLPEDITAGWGACKLAAGWLLGGELVNVGYDVVFIKYANHSGPIDKSLCYALCIYFFYSKFSD
jgi:hypothetical protein